MMAMKRAVILLSGGVDSATCLALAKANGYACYALAFDYSQRHRFELTAAARLAKAMHATEFRIAPIDLRMFGGSALTSDIPVPKDRPQAELTTGIPITYVPARNTVFLSFALAWAEVIGSYDIFIGVNSIDYSGYPDCRPEYIAAFTQLANLATRAGVEGKAQFQIHTPLLHLTKAEIIQTGTRLGVDYSLTHSCYDPAPDGRACGHCDSCMLRLAGFAAAGLRDPGAYQ